MTRLCFLFVLYCLFNFTPAAQAQDTLWVQQRDNKPYLLHKIRSGENLFLLSKRYSVPPAVLADHNDVTYQDGLSPGLKFKIPIDKYNYIRIEGMVDSRPLYYKADEEDNLHSISRMFNVSQGTIQRWNHMNDAAIEARQVLQVGWIAYDKSQKPFPSSVLPVKSDTLIAKIPRPGVAPSKLPKPAGKPVKDSMIRAVIAVDSEDEETALEKQFKAENDGISLTEEAGAAVFYNLKAAQEGVYYAFHNMARKGSVIKVQNPASRKIIYAKVIGPIPNLKEYHNAIVGLSSNAVPALGAHDKRMFCKLKYR